MDLAKGKKTVVGVETVQNQFALITGMPDDIAILSLKSVLHAGPIGKNNDREMEDLWLRGDSKALANAFETSAASIPKPVRVWEAAGDKKRNLKMVDCAQSHLKNDKVSFMVVGAEHLCADDSVITLLRKRGYKVEQVNVR